ncbi:MAG: hypothetical protein RR997_06485, partial [Raoultibacter sp.]
VPTLLKDFGCSRADSAGCAGNRIDSHYPYLPRSLLRLIWYQLPAIYSYHILRCAVILTIARKRRVLSAEREQASGRKVMVSAPTENKKIKPPGCLITLAENPPTPLSKRSDDRLTSQRWLLI